MKKVPSFLLLVSIVFVISACSRIPFIPDDSIMMLECKQLSDNQNYIVNIIQVDGDRSSLEYSGFLALGSSAENIVPAGEYYIGVTTEDDDIAIGIDNLSEYELVVDYKCKTTKWMRISVSEETPITIRNP